MKTLLSAAFLGMMLAVPARATILYVGSEDIDVISVGSGTSTSTSTSFIRSGWARAGVSVQSAGAADPPANRIKTAAFANQGTIWFHSQMGAGSTTTTSNTQVIRVIGSDGNARILVRGTGTAGQLKISTRTTAGVITDLVTCTAGVWPLSGQAKMDLFLNYAVAGQVTLYFDSISVCAFTGDVTTDGITSVQQVEGGGPSTGAVTVFSEMIVSTTDTRALGVRTLAPVASGNTQAWTPNTVGNVNPTTIADANFVASVVNNDLSQWTIGTSALPSGNWNVPVVKQSARVIIGTSGPLNFSFNQRVGGNDFNTGSVAATTAFANYYNYLTVSPNTGIAWTTTEINTAGNNFGLKALP